MAVKGYLEAVDPFQVRGWVYDSHTPSQPLIVEIFLNGRIVGLAKANIYRKDLEQAGIGAGDHAFVYNFDHQLGASDLPMVAVRVPKSDGSFESLSQVPVVAKSDTPAPAPDLLGFDGTVSDNDQHPVFVLGAARSGTSAMAQALLKLSRFKGHQEGHLLDLLAHLTVVLDKFYAQKADERVGRDTTVSLVPMEYFQSAFNEVFIRVIRRAFPDGRWVDKTPNSNMIYLAPRFRSIWPNSRFIFMKRRFLENAASRAIKFPAYTFSWNCTEWNNVMQGWLAVRPQLEGAAIELDQKFLRDHPDAAADAIQRLLELSDVEKDRLGQSFRYDFPERTVANQQAGIDMAALEWSDEQIEDFERYCEKTMGEYGYSVDTNYYRAGCEANGLVWV